MSNTLNKLWDNIVQWFHAEAAQLQYVQFDQTDAPTLKPNDSYIRIVISELWVKNSVDWGKEKFPAVQAAAKLAYGGQTPTTFATLARPTAEQLGPGVFRDYELTYLMPYLGQTVEIELGLYEILGKNHLQTALDVVGDFASLVAPPLSTAVTVMDKVASGIDRVITANGSGPVLGLHGTLSPAGGQEDGLRPGWIAVVRATKQQLPGDDLRIVGGRLHRLTSATATEPLTGFDYVVVRIEGKATRAEGSEWMAPDIDRALSDARLARDTGTPEEFADARKAVLTKVYYSPDFSPSDRKRVAQLVKEDLDDATAGAAGDGQDTVASIVERRGLPSASEVESLTIEDLIA